MGGREMGVIYTASQPLYAEFGCDPRTAHAWPVGDLSLGRE